MVTRMRIQRVFIIKQKTTRRTAKHLKIQVKMKVYSTAPLLKNKTREQIVYLRYIFLYKKKMRYISK